MSTKSEIIKKLEIVPEYEQLFLLRAQDEMAPLTIMEWIKNNFFTAPEEKLRSAFEVALIMCKQEDIMRKRAD